MDFSSIAISNIILLSLIGLYVVLIGFILTWVYHDAERRGVLGWVVVPLVFFSGSSVIGTLLWLVFRPKLKPVPVERQ